MTTVLQEHHQTVIPSGSHTKAITTSKFFVGPWIALIGAFTFTIIDPTYCGQRFKS